MNVDTGEIMAIRGELAELRETERRILRDVGGDLDNLMDHFGLRTGLERSRFQVIEGGGRGGRHRRPRLWVVPRSAAKLRPW
jgi:hypothetical protein